MHTIYPHFNGGYIGFDFWFVVLVIVVLFVALRK
jgi:hypothetical protein